VNVKTACELAETCRDSLCTPEQTKQYTLDIAYGLSVSKAVLCSLDAEQVDVAFIIYIIFFVFTGLAWVVTLAKFCLRLKAFGDVTIVVLSMVSSKFGSFCQTLSYLYHVTPLESCLAILGFITMIYFIWYGNNKGGYVADVHSSSTQLVEYSFGAGFFLGLLSWFLMGTLLTASPVLLFMPIIKEEKENEGHED
jgi:hypothetical protein